MMRWWMAVAMMVVVAVTRVQAFEHVFKDPDGGSTLAKILACNDCKAGSGKACDDGAEVGWLEGKPCGKCLLDSNYGAVARYPYDLQVTGKLTNAAGEPIKDRFVKLFMPNGWGVRTRTTEAGTFRMTMGATVERKKSEAVIIDIGTHVDSVKGDADAQFSLFMLPEEYKSCAADTVIEEPKKAPAKGKKGTAKP